jgi:hypothetical protein
VSGERPRIVVILGLFLMFLNCAAITGAAIGYGLHGFVWGWVIASYAMILTLAVWALFIDEVAERWAARRGEKA